VNGGPGGPGGIGGVGGEAHNGVGGHGGTGGTGGAGSVGRGGATKRTVFWLALWLVLQGLAVSYGLWLSRANDQHQRELVRAELAEDKVEEAQRCVNVWRGRVDIRDMAEAVYRTNAETLVSLATSTDPERINQYLELVELDVAAIRAELPDPDCDLQDAQQILDEQD